MDSFSINNSQHKQVIKRLWHSSCFWANNSEWKKDKKYQKSELNWWWLDRCQIYTLSVRVKQQQVVRVFFWLFAFYWVIERSDTFNCIIITKKLLSRTIIMFTISCLFFHSTLSYVREMFSVAMTSFTFIYLLVQKKTENRISIWRTRWCIVVTCSTMILKIWNCRKVFNISALISDSVRFSITSLIRRSVVFLLHSSNF